MKTRDFLAVATQLPYLTKQNLQLPLNLNESALSYWIKKMIDQGELITIKKGMYFAKRYLELTQQVPSKTERYFEYLACEALQPSYLSLEYILAKNGFIPESTFAITAVTTKTPREYQVEEMTRFYYRNVKQELFWGWCEKKFENFNYQVATPSKALLDYLYLKPLGSKEAMKEFLLESGRFNWSQINEVCTNFPKLVAKTNSRKLELVLKIIQKEKLI